MIEKNHILILYIILLGLLISCNSTKEKKQLVNSDNNKEEELNFKNEEKTFSSIKLMNMKSKIVSDSILINRDGPLMIVFWGTTCGPCIKELNSFSSKYNKWQADYNLKLIAVSPEYLNTEILNQLIERLNTNKDTLIKRQNERFINFQKKYSFNFELYLDNNDELTDFLNTYDNIDTTYITSGYSTGKSRVWIPQTIIFDNKRKLIKQKIGYKEGDEKEIEKILNEIENAL